METLFRIQMLGRFAVWQGSREITRFRTQKTASLLAYLALYPDRSHSRQTLIELFWPENTPDAARANLSVALSALRRQLEPPGVAAGSVLIADLQQVRLNPLAFTSDVQDFENLLQEAHTAADPQKRLDCLKSAIDLYQGDLLPGHYEEWALGQRDRLPEAYRQALSQVIQALAQARQLEAALVYARRLVQADPLREESYRQLMQLYKALGRAGEALACYEELERLLRQQLQATPSSATRALADQLRQMAEPARKREARAADKASEESTASLTPGGQRAAFKVPLQFTRFYGREEALSDLIQLLSRPQQSCEQAEPLPAVPGSRLMTLTGPGGTGKTRLSIELAGKMKEVFAGGIWFVSLAEVSDPLLIGEALRDALELPRKTQPAALEQVLAYLNSLEAPCLLILDNFEQITAGGASVVWTLLQRVALLHCLVTSRQTLSLPGEREIPLSPLPVPHQDKKVIAGSLLTTHLLSYASVALFVDRAQTALPVFQITPRNAQAIASVCARLEGLPLAIELAAARVKMLTPAQIEERLSERFALLASKKGDKVERHRSLWAAIDWSYHLLAPDVQRFFGGLSVFRGGWSLEAAEAICEEPLALEYLSQLKAHSLIVAEEGEENVRFRMLESIREFAGEQLSSDQRQGLERRHAAYFHQWVNGMHLSGKEYAVRFPRLEEDLDNLRAVLERSRLEGHDIETGLHLAGRLFMFWNLRGHLSEGRRWYARLLERAGDSPTEGLGLSLYGAGALASLMGDFPAAQPLLERCLDVALALGDEAFIDSSHNELGSIAYRQGDYAQARFHYETSLEMARVRGHPYRLASVLGNLANVAQSTGDYATSRTLNEESLELWRKAEDRYGEARTLHNLANLAHSQGQLAEARTYYEQSLEIKRDLADRYGLSFSLVGLSSVEKDQGDVVAAAAHARESLALARELNARMNQVNILYLLSGLMQALGELEMAARMCGAFKQVKEEMSYPLSPVDLEEFEQIQAGLREGLGAANYDSAQALGRQLSLEQALICLEETLASKGL